MNLSHEEYRPEFEPRKTGTEMAQAEWFVGEGGPHILGLSNVGRIDFEPRTV